MTKIPKDSQARLNEMYNRTVSLLAEAREMLAEVDAMAEARRVA